MVEVSLPPKSKKNDRCLAIASCSFPYFCRVMRYEEKVGAPPATAFILNKKIFLIFMAHLCGEVEKTSFAAIFDGSPG